MSIYTIEYKKVWCFKYIIPILQWRWCVVEHYKDSVFLYVETTMYDCERIVFSSVSVDTCKSMIDKLNCRNSQ